MIYQLMGQALEGGFVIEHCSERSQLFYRMHLLCKEMNNAFEAQLKTSFTKVEILYHIDHRQELSQLELQHLLVLDGAAVTRHLRRLEEEGLIFRSKKEQDKRVTYIRLTELGVQELQVLSEQRQAFQEKLLCKFTDEEIVVLTDVLQRMSSNVKNM
ncbi:MarR family winged helix-turn-helix transcriptional regulator [Paenibacillus sp. SEL1]|uniref:MarR family winged helix-turn-helix transcriptional regulator n=1 Tax=Paenibacillus TaxID=44249 RepID=UPI0020242B20|nr:MULTISPECIES: MarR family transcriptional regulator [Paenibacillus]MCP3781710.1 MarR family transcriptional regulator [Paenibacillus sp. MZ03-122A]MCP3797192.1 MarR family transcriptional regulator [Paenibacillus sp. CH40]URJ40344.1 MarR family transcriptional regulator [Paenibacillus polymyxa]